VRKPALSAHCKFAVKVKLFQHLRDAGEQGLRPEDLAQKTGVDVVLLGRIMRHLIAMKIVTFNNGTFLRTTLSDALAAENYQKSIDFCYDVSRPSFNGFPLWFEKTGYKLPKPLDGPFQAAHSTDLPFFPWLGANQTHLDEFGNFMASYRAGKANW